MEGEIDREFLESDIHHEAFAQASGWRFLWGDVYFAVKKKCEEEGFSDRNTKLCLALTKYNLATFPAEWMFGRFDEAVEYVLALTISLLSEPEKEQDIHNIITTYELGLTPNCFQEEVDFA